MSTISININASTNGKSEAKEGTAEPNPPKPVRASGCSRGTYTNPINLKSDKAGTLYLFGMLSNSTSDPKKLYIRNHSVKPSDRGYEYYQALAYRGIPNVLFVLYNADDQRIVQASSSSVLEKAYNEVFAADYLHNPEAHRTGVEETDEDIDCWRTSEIIRQQLVWKWRDADIEEIEYVMNDCVRTSVANSFVDARSDMPVRCPVPESTVSTTNTNTHAVIANISVHVSSPESKTQPSAGSAGTDNSQRAPAAQSMQDNEAHATNAGEHTALTKHVTKYVYITQLFECSACTLTEIDVLYVVIFILLVCLAFSIYDLVQ